jgi:NaMN:DMB phosphoribosyltransferase
MIQPSTKTATIETLAAWLAAQEIIKRYPQVPEVAACQIAPGNMWEFKVWQRMAKAAGIAIRR